MEDFDKAKEICLGKLYKPDKSRKGDVDTAIIPIIDHINSLNNYYTTSSCSGRIMLLTQADKKPDVKWIYVTHEKTSFKEIMNSLTENIISENPTIWLRQENLILHVACRTMSDANKILKIARDIGLRRSGIIADSNIIIVEICSTEKIDVPISNDGKLIVDEEYINFLVNIANEKSQVGKEKLKRLLESFKEL